MNAFHCLRLATPRSFMFCGMARSIARSFGALGAAVLDVDEDIISDEGDRGLRYDKFECREVSSQHDYRMYESMLKVNSGAKK